MIVLLVDDEPTILKSTRLLLEAMGHIVHATSRADEVMPMLEAHRPGLLLQDVRMQGLDLADLVDKVRASPQGGSIAIALFSARLDLAEVAAALGVRLFLEKPFGPAELQGLLEAAQLPLANGPVRVAVSSGV